MRVWGEKIDDRTLRLYGRFSLADLPARSRLRIEVDADRNGKFNALVHVLIGMMVKAINAGPAQTSTRDLKRWIKLKRGWFELVPLPRPLPDGTTHAVEYRSTSYADMSEGEFRAFVSDLCTMVEEDLAPWLRDAPEWAEIDAIVSSIHAERAQA